MWQLERLAPAQKRGEQIDLDDARPTRMRMGRASDCDVLLFSATASRCHAELRREPDGSWWILPVEGCLVLADGAPVSDRCELCEGLALELGRDRLRCRAAARVGDQERPHRAVLLPGSRPPGVLLALAALVLLAVIWLRSCG